MIGDADVQATIPVRDMEAAMRFYGETLGLKVVTTRPRVVVYMSGSNSYLQIYQSDNAGSNKGTSATWEVQDIEKDVQNLKSEDVSFERYDAITGAEIDSSHIYETNGHRAAWFRDPDGNILCLHTTT